MAAKDHSNFYAAAKNNPEVLEKRRQRQVQLDEEVRRMQAKNAGRQPAWDEARVMLMDRAALELGKRCVLWDDAGAGFFLMLNWDWLNNWPAAPTSPYEACDPGWYANAKQLLSPPLLDPSVGEDRLAEWLRGHTVDVHRRLETKLDKVRVGSQPGQRFVLEEGDEYWVQLLSLPR